MTTQTNASEFLELARTIPIIDVRSENEYIQGHIPEAINLPLFNNEERAIIGTLYKNSGREASVLKGLEITGPKLADYVKQLHKITGQKQLLVHCWRGGMRSESMAWLFQVAGYEVFVLRNGYKSYRHFIRETMARPANIIVLGGLTGSGKTELLQSLGIKGEQILDLERLASHKGSVFGGLGQPGQPTNEQFENDIFAEWQRFDLTRPIWIEDESRMIGNVSIPDPLFEQMQSSIMIKMETGKEQRIRRLVSEYSTIERQDLGMAILKIGEKLGGANTKKALKALESGDLKMVADLALFYYDKTYTHSVQKRQNQQVYSLNLESSDTAKNAILILEAAKSLGGINH
ncbi:MAG: tRNA 2-selenouridine(34) synthase MnmH [Bacteroidales bacterium]|jgi:tRNA 2-selenouridine synthase